MPGSDPLGILLAHNHWSTRNMLEACVALTSEQFHQRFELGPGSLHDTLRHCLGAMTRWGDLLAGRVSGAPLEATAPRTAIEMLELLDLLTADLRASAEAHPNDETLTAVRGGKTYAFTRGAILTHVTTHGMHHRAQCLNMLRRLGVEPLPASSVMEWTLTGDRD